MYNTVGLMEQKERELTETAVFISAVYSADVLDGHRTSTAAPAERCDDTLLPQNERLASVSADSRAVIILVPVRLGGEKTNPDYFNLAKVRHAGTLPSLKHSDLNPQFFRLEHSESGLLHRHPWREAQTGLLLCWIPRLVWVWYKTERRTTSFCTVKRIVLHNVALLCEETRWVNVFLFAWGKWRGVKMEASEAELTLFSVTHQSFAIYHK